MYNIIVSKTKAVTQPTAATPAHVSKFNFQPDATRNTPPSVHHYLSQEAPMIPVPNPKEKAAGATAASGAQQSALPSNPIVPPLRGIAMEFRSFFPTITPPCPIRHIKLSYAYTAPN